jgi:ribonuclease HI
VDAALFPDGSRMGWGAVIRDHTGVVKLSASEGIDCITSPEVAEALAIHSALSIAFHHGFKDIILASDWLSMIQRVCSPMVDRWTVGSLVTNIKKPWRQGLVPACSNIMCARLMLQLIF